MNTTSSKKRVFIAFAMEDKVIRDFLVGQRDANRSPFEFVDMSVDEPYPAEEWKQRVRTRIKGCAGVIVLVSSSTLKASGQLWEIKCALEEKKPILAIWAYRADRTLIPGLNVELWSDPNIIKFLENL